MRGVGWAGRVVGVIFRQLNVWVDGEVRPGPEAMAVDEWLLEAAGVPVLRVYGWLGEWGSLGYFGNLAEARRALPGVEWVRRWTGGGLVDHRDDWTYTLAVPREEEITRRRGAESYEALHEALRAALRDEGMAARLASGDGQTGDALCFANPVAHDLVAVDGRKLAGAGQRRARCGLLHQGSVAGRLGSEESVRRARLLAARLAESWQEVRCEPPVERIAALVAGRYGAAGWTARR